ncbi:MAG: hypothetical protein AAF409_07155 [Pseudomonadota bacterium]
MSVLRLGMLLGALALPGALQGCVGAIARTITIQENERFEKRNAWEATLAGMDCGALAAEGEKLAANEEGHLDADQRLEILENVVEEQGCP